MYSTVFILIPYLKNQQLRIDKRLERCTELIEVGFSKVTEGFDVPFTGHQNVSKAPLNLKKCHANGIAQQLFLDNRVNINPS